VAVAGDVVPRMLAAGLPVSSLFLGPEVLAGVRACRDPRLSCLAVISLPVVLAFCIWSARPASPSLVVARSRWFADLTDPTARRV